ncbi:MAG: hypothetical protein Q8S13_02765 [Dehalococcoidia bacterium]|nr:hypothetical protein [Dehalococcoidia bacterium]
MTTAARRAARRREAEREERELRRRYGNDPAEYHRRRIAAQDARMPEAMRNVLSPKGLRDAAWLGQIRSAHTIFAPGDIVKYTSKFLRSTGWYTNVPIDGRVESVRMRRGGEPDVLRVLWNDRDEPVSVLASNVMLARKPDLT